MSDREQDNLSITAPKLPPHERPIWIWAPMTGAFIWANSEAIKFWQATSLEQLQAHPVDEQHPAWDLVNSTFNADNSGEEQKLNLTFPREGQNLTFVAKCRRRKLHGGDAIIVEIVGSGPQSDTYEHKKIAAGEEALTQELAQLDDGDDEKIHSSGHKISLSRQQATQIKSGPLDSPPFLQRPPKESLDELARLIEEARVDKPMIVAEETNDNQNGEDEATTLRPVSGDDHPSQQSENGEQQIASLNIAQDKPLDMVALSGVRDQRELEDILNDCESALALINGKTLIYANPGFVSEFGYGDFQGLKADGLDWILPGSPSLLSELLTSSDVERRIEVTSRLRSGRKLQRLMEVKSLTLTKFAAPYLLVEIKDVHETSILHDQPTPDESIKSKGRDEFDIELLGQLSHEVRTPLTVICGFAEVMYLEKMGPMQNEKYKDYAHDIYESAQHALSLINDLLDLSKLKAGKWDLNLKQIDVNMLVRGQTRLMRGLAFEKGVRLSTTIEETLPPILADERALKQILLNILSNAIKFSSRDDLVSVTTQLKTPNMVEIIIADQGVGMDDEDIERALLPFKQVGRSHPPEQDKGRERQMAGTGLGLPIAKALAEAQGINFKIMSKKGFGTSVVLSINV